MAAIRSVLSAAALAALAVVVAPPASEAACVANVAPNDTLNVRSGPGVLNKVVAELAHDYCGVELSGDYSGRWGRVRFFGGRAGWVAMRYIDEGGDGGGASGPAPAVPGKALTAHEFATGDYCPNISDGDRLNVRAGPNTEFPVIGGFKRDFCTISGTGNCFGDWCETVNSGFTGWINTRYLRNVESGD